MLAAEDGSRLWSYEMGGRIYSTPCIVDGHIWVGSTSQDFSCFGPVQAG
jgi:outer membrane protein assembly factor BamB